MAGEKQLSDGRSEGLLMGRDENDKIGFYGLGPVTRQAVPISLVQVEGTADGTIADVGATFDQAILNNNFKELWTSVAALRLALVNLGLVG